MYSSYQGETDTHRREPDYREVLLASIQRENAALDLYSRLAYAAPDANHQRVLLQALDSKRQQLHQFASLYAAIAGSQPPTPMYRTEPVSFQTCREGLDIALAAGREGGETYERYGLQTRHPLVRQVFLYAASVEQDNAERLGRLNGQEARRDYGPEPYVVDIERVTEQNHTYRTAIWTGEHLQVTVMSIGVGDDIGLEVHPHTDQFIRIEEGRGLVQMGPGANQLTFVQQAGDGYAVMIPAGTWHNVTNIGREPLKVYVIYAPPEHPRGTVHPTKAAAMAAEHGGGA